MYDCHVVLVVDSPKESRYNNDNVNVQILDLYTTGIFSKKYSCHDNSA